MDNKSQDLPAKPSWIRRNVVGRGLRYIIGGISLPPSLATVYNVDDVVTLIMALIGNDPFTKDKLLSSDRLVYVFAALIPFLPSTILMDPLILVKESILEIISAKKSGQELSNDTVKKILKAVWIGFVRGKEHRKTV